MKLIKVDFYVISTEYCRGCDNEIIYCDKCDTQICFNCSSKCKSCDGILCPNCDKYFKGYCKDCSTEEVKKIEAQPKPLKQIEGQISLTDLLEIE